MSIPQVPRNTDASTRWSIKKLTEWIFDYNERNTSSKCPQDLLSPFCSKEDICKWLRVFVLETRSQNGDPYLPKTIYALLTGILRFMRSRNADYPNFLDKNDSSFATFHVTLDNLFKELRVSGVGASSSHCEGISIEEEDKLWSSGVLNTDTPKGLLRVVFYYNGLLERRSGAQRPSCFSVSKVNFS